jgi:phage terminase small subunit
MAKRPPAHLTRGRDGKVVSKREKAERIAKWAEVLAKTPGAKTRRPKATPKHPPGDNSNPQGPESPTTPSGVPLETSEWPAETKKRPRKTKAAQPATTEPARETNSSIDTETATSTRSDGYDNPACVCGKIPRQLCSVHPIEKTATRPKVSAPAEPSENERAGEPAADQPTELTAKQARFVEEFAIDNNGAAAARRAGYSKKTAREQAHALLSKPHIQDAVAASRAKLAEVCAITAQDLIREAAKMAFANQADWLYITSDGDPYIDLSSCTRDQLAALQDVSIEDFVDGRGEDARQVKRVRVRMADKRAAMALIADLLGFSAKKQVELSGAVKVDDGKRDAALKERIKRMDEDELRAYLELNERYEQDRKALFAGKGEAAA